MTSLDGRSDKRTARHFLRTLLQVLVALGGGIPAAAAAFDLPASTTARIAAVVGLLVLVVTAAQNAGEQTGVIPTLLPNPLAVPQPPSSVGSDPAHPDVPAALAGGEGDDPPVADLDLGRPPYRGRPR